MINCQICKREFETDKAFHIHLKKHGMYQAEYYCTYYPRKSLFYRRRIPFKNKKDYFSRQFIDLNEFLTWEKVGEKDLVKSKALELLEERAREKKYSYAPFHNEIKTLGLPPISIFKKYFGSYKRACDLLGLSPVFDQPMPKCFNDMELPQFEILVDTREQDPLPFKKTKIEKLYVGDYLFGDGTYTSTFVDRKSEGDFLTLEQAFIRHGLNPLVYRFASFQTHYRKPMEYSEESVDAARNGLLHLQNQVRRVAQNKAGQNGSVSEVFKAKFIDEINDDLNMPRALAVVQEMLKSDISDAAKFASIMDFDRVLGLSLDQLDKPEALPAEVQKLVEDRQAARANKDWARSDLLRDEIQNLGYSVQDTKDGMKVLKA